MKDLEEEAESLDDDAARCFRMIGAFAGVLAAEYGEQAVYDALNVFKHPDIGMFMAIC